MTTLQPEQQFLPKQQESKLTLAEVIANKQRVYDRPGDAFEGFCSTSAEDKCPLRKLGGASHPGAGPGPVASMATLICVQYE